MKQNSQYKGLAIEVKNVTNKFKNVIANNNINLKIHHGEKIALLGGNGAGKTTLIECIIGTSQPHKGKIIRNFSKNSKNFKEDIGVQFQDAKYPPGLRVKDIINFINAIGDNKWDRNSIKEMIKAFKMEDFYRNESNSLSGGQSQKLNILLALINNPKLLVLDEVSTGLDIQAKSEIKKYIKKYITKHNTTLLLVSHDMDEVEMLCDRVIAMNKGKVVFDGPVEEIKSKYGGLEKFLENNVIN